MLAAYQWVTRMYLKLKEKVYANNLFNANRKDYKVGIHVIQDLLKNKVISSITQEFHMILDPCL